jgi:hypothetical protein
VTTSKVRHSPAAGVSASTGIALERAQPAHIELFARKKSRRFIRFASTFITNDNGAETSAREHLLEKAPVCCPGPAHK